MKKISYIITAIIIFISVTACDSFLDSSPRDEITDSTFWNSEGDVTKLMINLYDATFPGSGIFWDEAMSDNARLEHAWWGGQKQVADGSISPGGEAGSKPSGVWSSAYASIRKSWFILENIDKVPYSDPKNKEITIAEIRAILAYDYSVLVTYFGDVPLITKRLTVVESKKTPRNKKEEVLSFIFEQADLAASVLKNVPKSGDRRGRVNWETCLAIKARTFLYQNDYANVLKVVQELKGGGYYLHTAGDTPYEDLFSGKAETSPEIIFSRIRMPRVGDLSAGHAGNGAMFLKGMSGGDVYCAIFPSGSLVDAYPMADGRLIHEAGSTYDPQNPYKNRDPRFYQTIIYPTGNMKYLDATTKTVKTTRFDPEDKTTLIALTLYNAAEPTRTGYIWNKYIDYSVYAMTDPWDCTNDIIIFRYADILLMEAEALAELKGAASAGDICNLIDQLRDRCGAGKVNRENYTTKENLINLVRNERRIELANEGLRYFDIIRWKQAELNTVKYGVGLVGPMYGAKMEQVDEKAPGYADPTVMVDGVKRRLVEQRYFNPARNYLFPIPQSERDLNTALTQNSGWD